MNTGDWISAALALVQIAAIFVGALWAYYKFVRGRIFHKRAEPSLEASLVSLGSSYAVRAKLALKNTGSSDIPLRVTLLTLAAHRAGDIDERGQPRWQEIGRAHAFRDDEGNRDHEDLESQETITDDLLLPIRTDDTPESGVFAYRVICQVYERREEGGGICWTTKAMVPIDRASIFPTLLDKKDVLAGEGIHAYPSFPGDRVAAQRPASESEIQATERQTD